MCVYYFFIKRKKLFGQSNSSKIKLNDVVIVSATRTLIGSFLEKLLSLAAPKLGTIKWIASARIYPLINLHKIARRKGINHMILQ